MKKDTAVSINVRKKVCKKAEFFLIGAIHMERVMGIEPTLSAWEAEVLPLNYTRDKLA